jgi:hypothetical protein
VRSESVVTVPSRRRRTMCEHEKVMVCGEPACGVCFAERMEREKAVAPKRPTGVWVPKHGRKPK